MGCLEGQPSGQEVGVCLGGPGGGRKATEEGTRPAAQLRGGRRAPHLLLVAAAHAQQLRAVLLLQPRRLRLELALQPLAQVPQRRALLRRQRAHLVLQAPLQLLLLLLHLLAPRRAAGCGRQQHLRENQGPERPRGSAEVSGTASRPARPAASGERRARPRGFSLFLSGPHGSPWADRAARQAWAFWSPAPVSPAGAGGPGGPETLGVCSRGMRTPSAPRVGQQPPAPANGSQCTLTLPPIWELGQGREDSAGHCFQRCPPQA